MKIAWTLLVFCSLTGSASAGLWYYGTNMHGEPVSVNGTGPEAYVRGLTNDEGHLRIKNDANPPPDPGLKADF